MNTSEVVIEPWPGFENYWSVSLKNGRNAGFIERSLGAYRFAGVHDFYRLDAYAQQLVTEATNKFIALQKITDRMLA